MRKRYILALTLILLFLPPVVASSPPDVTLVSPAEGNVSLSNNVTFICDVTDDGNVYRISLYNNVNGTFSLYNTKRIMELEKDANTTLLCRFDGTYVCEDGERGTNKSTDFVNSRFMQGVKINNSDTLTYPTSNNILTSKGTIEFWLRLGFDPYSEIVWLFSTGSSNHNEMQIRAEYGTLYFDFYDDYGYSQTAYRYISTWNKDEWHHVSVIWDLQNLVGSGKILDMFVDGSNNSVFYTGNFYSYGTLGDNMYIGSYADGSYQANSVFDEFRISDKPRSPAEINISYMKGAGDHRNETAKWTLTNLADGIYKWNCFAYDNESLSSWNDTNHTFYVDTNPPTVNFIKFSPNSTDEVDPGVTVNFTANVTDISNVSNVVFQWRKTADWDTPPIYNETMYYDNSTGLYKNASITFGTVGEPTYYYRIWSNDTVGHTGYSITYNITPEWDYTWKRNPSDLGTVYGFLGCPKCYVGTIVVNNTGDDTLSFLLTDDWPLNIYYNISNPFSLGPKNVTFINVTAQFPDEDSENFITITITASHGSETPSPVSQTVTATLNSYSGGPYFDSDDLSVNYPTSVYQGMSYNLSVRLKNIGNESANNVWINWSLPAGWTNTSGDLNQYVDDLNGTTEGGNTVWNNITVYIDPNTATAGVQILHINATSSSKNLTANSSVVMYVLCNNDDNVCGMGCSYVTDDDCPRPSGGSTEGEGAATKIVTTAAKEYEIVLDIPARFDINRGETKTLKIGVKNTVEDTELNNVHLTLSGYPQTFISFSPVYLTGIKYGETRYFDVEIKAPIYAVYKEYDLNVTVKGEFLDAGKTVKAGESVGILLVTHKLIENETMEYFKKAKEAFDEMNRFNFETGQIKEMLEEIEKAMDEGNYARAKELSKGVLEIKDLAFKLNTQMVEMEEKIKSIKKQNFNLPETEKLLFLTKSAFQRGEYERADGRMSSALFMFAIESGGAAFWILMYKYWWLVLIAIFVSGGGMLIGRRRLIFNSLTRTLDSLAGEEEKLKELIMKTQKEYFGMKIGFEKYSELMEDYENGFVDIRKKRADILSKLTRMMPKKVVGILKEEEKRVKNLIAETQKTYFHKGEMGKGCYEKMMEGLKSELFEIQRLMEMLESGGNA